MSENIERMDTIDFWLFGHSTDKVAAKSKEVAGKHYLNGMDWEENRPKMLTQFPWEERLAILEKLSAPVLTAPGAYKTSLEFALIIAINNVRYFLNEVNEFGEATPEDFRRAIAKALNTIDHVGIDAKRQWERMVEARTIYKMQHPEEVSR